MLSTAAALVLLFWLTPLVLVLPASLAKLELNEAEPELFREFLSLPPLSLAAVRLRLDLRLLHSAAVA